MLTFLSPLFLIGLLAAGIPLIIHLSRSKRTKKMRFSTTRFFTDQFLRSYRMSRLKELLLLACRMALCALLAMAFARPLLMPRSSRSFLGGGSRAVALVLDDSASMAYTEDGQTLLDRARQAARTVLDSLVAQDTVSIVLAGRRAGGPVTLSESTASRDEMRRQLDSARPAPLGTDLSAAIARAAELLRERDAANKQIYVLSDLQDSGWEDATGESGQVDADIAHIIVRIQPKQVTNVAITAVQCAAARPVVGMPFAIRPHVISRGDVSRPATIRLYIDGDKVGERKLPGVQDGRWAAPTFYHSFNGGGWHSGYVEVDDDNLMLDNRRYFAFDVLSSLHVLAVDGAPSDIPRLDELFFLKAGLGAAGSREATVHVDTIGAAALERTNLDAYPLVILANVASLTGLAVEKLENYVDRGGSLLVFLGDQVDPAWYNRELLSGTRLHGGLLPARLRSLRGDAGKDEDFAGVGDVAFEHPALSVFEDPQSGLDTVTVKALWQMEPEQSAVLMQARTHGNHQQTLPLLCEKSFGKGRVLLFASTCDRDWTNFPIRPAYLLWLHRLVGYLGQRPLGRDQFFSTGQPIPIAASAVEGLPRVQVKKPDGSVAYPVASDDSEQPLRFVDTDQPGVYRLIDLDRQTEQLLAVNLDSAESDLTYLNAVLAEGAADKERQDVMEQGLARMVGPGARITYVEDPTHLGEVATGTGQSVRLWDVLLWIVLMIALIEPWLANRISLRHYARPRSESGASAVDLAPVANAPGSERRRPLVNVGNADL